MLILSGTIYNVSHVLSKYVFEKYIGYKTFIFMPYLHDTTLYVFVELTIREIGKFTSLHNVLSKRTY